MNVLLKMNEVMPMDDILRVLKRKQRYSLDSTLIENSDDSEYYEAKDDLKTKKKTQIIKKDGKEKKLQPMDKTKRQARRNHSVENQTISLDEVDDDVVLEVESADEAENDSDYKSPDEADSDSDYKAANICEKKQYQKRARKESSDSDYTVHDSSTSDESYDSDKKENSFRNAKKKAKVKKTENKVKVHDSSTSDESYDSDKKENSFRNVKKKAKVKKKENKVKSTVGISSYEQMIQERKREAMAFLETLKINDIKADCNALLKNKKGQSENTDKEKKQTELQSHSLVGKKAKANLKTKKNTRGIKEDEISSEPMRKSKRLALQTENVENQSDCKHVWSFKDTLAMENNAYEEYLDNVNIKVPNQTKPLFYSKSTFESLNLDPSNEFCLQGNKFTSLTWHSSTRPLILVAGNKQGYIAIMNIDTGAYFFKPHKNLVSHVKFNPYNPVQLFSTSLDGKLLCGDMEKHIFSEVYKSDVPFNYFDILSLTTCLIAQKNGKVAIVDNRTRRKRATQLTCHTNSIETVNLHPTNQNYFVTAENKGSICLWDLRRIQEHPVASVNSEKTLNSAFFSPLTGNSILATTDCEVCCFDSTHLMGNLNLLHKKKFSDFHSCRARASWVPNSDKMFVIGSVEKIDSKIEVYDKNMELYHPIVERKSISNCTFINAFHPYIPCFASTYTLGKQGHILVCM